MPPYDIIYNIYYLYVIIIIIIIIVIIIIVIAIVVVVIVITIIITFCSKFFNMVRLTIGLTRQQTGGVDAQKLAKSCAITLLIK